ncbi:MAG TPA: lipid carrier--UDP-N-acetylgalactosaminyltransferase [Proteiniclasticum sp.]|uniref:sugar transferase n=1 Tax=Proteiniclasticum sp. TaxID=2053595 RepID=UPI000E88678E|nr:sugar transferase [Proteiniclasticum sp.]HBW13340.1 lipid carrier--UDP-N-acetylgalactosaminyltransferase [Proteiniclasticum sp.]
MKYYSVLGIKRLFDIVFSFISIIILTPIFFLIAILIRVDGKEKILFRQQRLGLHSKPFNILKFRTMKVDAPNIAAKDIDNDAYVTRVGKVLRRTSLDELPQLFNILVGQMSFVGPRPLIPNEGEINSLRSQAGVDEIRPGLTGWAQVVARDTCDDLEKLSLDVFYKENESFLLDLKIILRTFTSLRGK